MKNNARNILIEKRGFRKDTCGDTLSLYISNNPVAAQWLVNRTGNSEQVVLELCCGVGITLGSLASAFKRAIGVDVDKEILDACKENLKKANLLSIVELVLGDVENIDLLKSFKADVVIYDIPYWYPEKYPNYSVEEKQRKNPDLAKLVHNIRENISKDIVIFAPREMGYEYFKNALGECECIEILIDGKHDRNYVLFGGLIKKAGSHSISL